jgi:hypothetical protein
VIVAATTVVLVVSVLLGLRYWGVLLAVATTTYQFSSVYGLSFGISVALNTLPVIYLLPRLLLRRRYGFTIVDFFLLVWIGGYFINFARSYSMDVPLEIFLRTLFFCGCYFMLGRLLVMDDDRGKRYLCEYAPAVILLTLFFALIAQDTSQQELASQIQFDMDAWQGGSLSGKETQSAIRPRSTPPRLPQSAFFAPRSLRAAFFPSESPLLRPWHPFSCALWHWRPGRAASSSLCSGLVH